MNLVEVLLAGLIFSLASAVSLQVMASLGRSLQGAAQAEAAETQLEAELRRSQALVKSGAQNDKDDKVGERKSRQDQKRQQNQQH